MAVRIKLLIKSRSSGKELEVIALVNSGFETIKPQLLLPIGAAEKLDLWPKLPNNFKIREYMTPAGAVKLYIVEDELKVKPVVEYSVDPVISDAVISSIEDEILISDKLAGALGIMVIDFAEGLWKLRTDPEDTVRRSYTKQRW